MIPLSTHVKKSKSPIITLGNYFGLYLRLDSSAICLVFSWRVTYGDCFFYLARHIYLHTSNRTATKSEISKAYRKLARKWHPDSYDGEDQEKAEKMFFDIAAAKEVLTDPGMYKRIPVK